MAGLHSGSHSVIHGISCQILYVRDSSALNGLGASTMNCASETSQTETEKQQAKHLRSVLSPKLAIGPHGVGKTVWVCL